MGRPRLYEDDWVHLHIEVPKHLKKRIDDESHAKHQKICEIARLAFEKYLAFDGSGPSPLEQKEADLAEAERAAESARLFAERIRADCDKLKTEGEKAKLSMKELAERWSVKEELQGLKNKLGMGAPLTEVYSELRTEHSGFYDLPELERNRLMIQKIKSKLEVKPDGS